MSRRVIRTDRPHSLPFVSGDTFRAFADHVFDETSADFGIAERVKRGDVVFVKADMIAEFFDRVDPNIGVPYVLVTHNSDVKLPGEYSIDGRPNIVAWFCQNLSSDSNDGRIHPIPIGLANMHWSHGRISTFIDKIRETPKDERDVDLYSNFDVRTNVRARQNVLEASRRLVSECPEFKIDVSTTAVHRDEYISRLARSKFVMSPEGNGSDCHRTWEAAVMGAIPIVTSGPLARLFDGMPVMIVESWDALTVEGMRRYYDDVSSRGDFRKLLTERSSGEYWLDKILRVSDGIRTKTSTKSKIL